LEFFIPHGTNSRINQLSSLSFILSTCPFSSFPFLSLGRERRREGEGGREEEKGEKERKEGGREKRWERGEERRSEGFRLSKIHSSRPPPMIHFTMFFSVFLPDLCLVPGAERERERERGEKESFKIEKKL
jgi:hypothetical protein